MSIAAPIGPQGGVSAPAQCYTLRREYGKTPNGNDLNGSWVLRNPCGGFIDFDQYRNDLIERHKLTIIVGDRNDLIERHKLTIIVGA
jgi:hypothetical protein